MPRFVESRWFALSVLILVIASGISLYLRPQSWMWALMPPVVMSIWRLVVRPASFHSPVWIASLGVFLTTAAIGYTVAYNESSAWNKLCLLIVAVLLYVNTGAQSLRNLKILAWLGLLTGVGVATYFLLTADFTALPVKFPWIHQLGVVWMKIRPNVFQLPAIHPNDTAGISIITGAYGLPLLRSRRIGFIPKLIVIAALGIILIAVLLTSSRGAFLGLIGALGVWFTWRLVLRLRSSSKEKIIASFPYLVIAAILVLEALVVFVSSGILGSSFSSSDNVFVSRAEVFRSSLVILRDFPFTGGGLASFPGLYSHYVLVMPFFYLPHSHNMILNVMIEQGVLGGIAFVLIYLIAVRQLLSTPQDTSKRAWYLAACLSLFTAIFHGMVDDYLYETSGPMLVLVPAGMAMLVSRIGMAERSPEKQEANPFRPGLFISRQQSVVGALFAVGLLGFLWKPIAAHWYANMGAVKMAKIELVDFPTGKWIEEEDGSRFEPAALDFMRALTYQADNETANHRLGLISMRARDYESASAYLKKAYEKDVTNRGLIKNLGYSYLWTGEFEKAQALLSRIPEAQHELEVYIWWWNDRQRPDLSDRAAQLAASIEAQP